MQCPYCGSSTLKVLDTTDTRSGIRRRRECQQCGERFTTYERSLASTPVLIKGNGNREEFDREKLKRGIWNACAKRPIPAAEIDRLAARIETYLQSLGRSEVSSRIVGDKVIEGLKDLDPIAYIRYAIVYLGLDNLLSVRSEIDKLLAEESVSQVSDPVDVLIDPTEREAEASEEVPVSTQDQSGPMASTQHNTYNKSKAPGRSRRLRSAVAEEISAQAVSSLKS